MAEHLRFSDAASCNRLATLAALFPNELTGFADLWRYCLWCIERWGPPPHWTGTDWKEEAQADLAAAVVVASRDFDSHCGAALRQHVAERMFAALRIHHQKERAYGLHCTPALLDAVGRDASQLSRLERWKALHEALEQLPAEDRLLLTALFWERRTEKKIARERGISRSKVSRWKSRVITALRQRLEKL